MRQPFRRSRFDSLVGWIVAAVAIHAPALALHAAPPDSDADRIIRRRSTPPDPATRDTAKPASTVPGITDAPRASWLVPLFLLLGLGLVAWFVKRRTRGGLLGGRMQMLDVLGRVSLSPKQTLYMVRMGRRVVLLGATAEQVNTLVDVSDPVEAAEIVGAAAQSRGESITSHFSEFLKSAAAPFREPTDRASQTAIRDTQPMNREPQPKSRGLQPARPTDNESFPARPTPLDETRSGVEELRRRLRTFAVNTTA